MELHYFHYEGGNFGDDLNALYWDKFLPNWRDLLTDHTAYGIGTLINDGMPTGKPKLIMGSGVGYGYLPSVEAQSECEYVALRGPRSARALGLDESVGVADPAVLVGEMDQFRDLPKEGPPVFVPHASGVNDFNWKAICAQAGIEYLTPQGSVESVIRRLGTAPLVIAESMHAAIISDALGTPWHAFAMARKFYAFKWLDWADSLEIDLTIERPVWQQDRKLLTDPPMPFTDRPAVQTAPSGHSALRQLIDKFGADALRNMVKSRKLVEQFKDLSQRPGNLSDRTVLEARKAELLRRFKILSDRA